MSAVADSPVQTIVVVVEPAGGDAAAVAARVALAAEAGRLAAALGARTRFFTWPPDTHADPAAVADAAAQAVLAEVTNTARAAEAPSAALAEESRAAVAPAIRFGACAAPVAVLVQDSDTGRQLAPLVAWRLDTCAVLSCSDARPSPEGLTFMKPVYGGWLEQEVRAVDGFLPVATLDLSGLEPPEAEAAQAAATLADAETLAIGAGAADSTPGDDMAAHSALPDADAGSLPSDAAGSPPRVRIVETLPPDARSVDLVHARRIVAAGMGTADEELMTAVQELAELLEGSVGATRPVVDEGLLPKERLIGQTGRTVAPELYLALGVSGSPHHVAGVRRADRVLSINRDVRAPILQFSDVGYVADLREVLPALLDRIRAWRDAAPGGRDSDGFSPPQPQADETDAQ